MRLSLFLSPSYKLSHTHVLIINIHLYTHTHIVLVLHLPSQLRIISFRFLFCITFQYRSQPLQYLPRARWRVSLRSTQDLQAAAAVLTLPSTLHLLPVPLTSFLNFQGTLSTVAPFLSHSKRLHHYSQHSPFLNNFSRYPALYNFFLHYRSFLHPYVFFSSFRLLKRPLQIISSFPALSYGTPTFPFARPFYDHSSLLLTSPVTFFDAPSFTRLVRPVPSYIPSFLLSYLLLNPFHLLDISPRFPPFSQAPPESASLRLTAAGRCDGTSLPKRDCKG